MAEINIAAVSQLVAEVGVEPLMFPNDPITKLMNKSYAAEFGMKTYQTGDTLRIRIEDQPAMPVQQTTQVIDPIVQQEISATVLNWTTGWNINTAFESLNLGGKDKLRETLKPRTMNMATQAALICYQELLTCPGFIGTPGTAFKTATDFGKARAALKDQLAMQGLYAIMTPDSMGDIAGDLADKFNPSKDSSVAYLDGEVLRSAGLNFYETPNMAQYHTNGTAAGTGTAGMYLSVNPASGATTITVAGNTVSAGTITKNSVINIPGVYEVNPQTKAQLGRLRNFTVTALTELSGGGGTISIFPPIYGPENPKLQTCSKLPVVSGTSTYVAIQGEPSGVYEQMLFMRKGSSAFISCKQEDLIMAQNGISEYEGVIVQTSAAGNITNRQNTGRIDLLATARNTQWRHQYRAFVKRVA
jgi:hypothetical protein